MKPGSCAAFVPHCSERRSPRSRVRDVRARRSQRSSGLPGRATAGDRSGDMGTDQGTRDLVRDGHADDDCSHVGHHPSATASGCDSPVSAARAAATSARLQLRTSFRVRGGTWSLLVVVHPQTGDPSLLQINTARASRARISHAKRGGSPACPTGAGIRPAKTARAVSRGRAARRAGPR